MNQLHSMLIISVLFIFQTTPLGFALMSKQITRDVLVNLPSRSAMICAPYGRDSRRRSIEIARSYRLKT